MDDKTRPAAPADLMADARRALRDGRPLQAAASLRALLSRQPNHRAGAELLARMIADSLRAAGAEAGVSARALAAGRADLALPQVERLLARAPCHPDLHLQRGFALMALRRMAEARDAFAVAVLLEPKQAKAQMALGTAAMGAGDPAGAAVAFSTAVRLLPDDGDALNNLGLALTEAGRAEEAVAPLERAAELAPALARVPYNLGNALRALGQADAAMAAYDRALALDPAHWGAANNRGTLLRETGDIAGAEAAFAAALAIRPDAAETRRNWAEVRRFTAGDPAIAALRDDLDRAKDPRARMQLAFALGKALDDVRDPDEAFAAFAEGNRRRKEVFGYDPEADARLFGLLERLPPAPPLDVAPAPFRPVFVTGMMRSGTSLVEQMLAAHPDVAAGGELEVLGQLALPLAEACLAAPDSPPSAEQLVALREGYFAATARVAAGKPVLTDKMPANFRWIGLILAAFPEARVLHLQRDPMAVGWSIFRTCFTARGNGYAWDLADIGRFHHWHDRLMAHFHALYPGRIAEIVYEDLVAHPQDAPARVLSAAGLGWHPAAADFTRAATQVRTASAVQVRQGIYKGSSDRWQNYAAHLGPLARAIRGETE